MAALTSRADVATDAPARYAKQLIAHLGRHVEFRVGRTVPKVDQSDGPLLCVISLRSVDRSLIPRVERCAGGLVNMTEIVMAAGITLGTVALAAASVNAPALTREAESTVGEANCRAVDTAILAYYADWQVLPAGIRDVEPYVQGDITGYRIVAGKAAGPGCATSN